MRNDKMAVGNRRLLRLADFIEQIPPERFKFSSWVGSDYRGKPGIGCGTTACAFGWATAMPLFRKLGLRLYKTGANGRHEPRICAGKPGYVAEESRDFEATEAAAMALFNLDPDGLEYLFLPSGSGAGTDGSRNDRYGLLLSNDATASMVACRIRSFVDSPHRMNGRV